MNEEERLRILELLEQTEGGDLPPFAVEEINKIFEKYKDLHFQRDGQSTMSARRR